MKRNILLLALAVLMAMPSFAGAKKKAEKDTEHFRYEIECAGNGTQGTYLVKVWSTPAATAAWHKSLWLTVRA